MGLDEIKEFRLDSYEDFRGEIFTVCRDGDDKGMSFNHDKTCIRYKNTLVGIHGDFKTYKLITCLYGRVFSALVDNRPDSPDFMKHKTFILSHENKKQLLIPPGIGNSFLVLSDVCVYNYKLCYIGDYNDHDKQFTLKWNDSRLNIFWPTRDPMLSERDF